MVILGILLAILAACIGTASKQLIAASAHYQRPWLFHLGAGMNVALGPVVDASAYAFAPQVVVAPFACLDVILNALTAPYTLHWQGERLTAAHVTGTALVFLGATLTSLFARGDNRVYSVEEIEAQLFFRPASVCYLLAELFAMAAATLSLRRRWLSPRARGVLLGTLAGTLVGNVFFLKGLIGIIQTTAETGRFEAWLRPTPYLLAAAAVAGAVLGHLFMRKGLGEYKGVFMVTVFEGAHIVAACLSGCVVMEEMADAPLARRVLYWSSVGCIVLGMVAIHRAAAEAQLQPVPREQLAEERDEEEEEEALGGSRPIGRSLEDAGARGPRPRVGPSVACGGGACAETTWRDAESTSPTAASSGDWTSNHSSDDEPWPPTAGAKARRVLSHSVVEAAPEHQTP